MRVLPEINSLEDYEKLTINDISKINIPGTIHAVSRVGIYMDDIDEISWGVFSYSGHGYKLVENGATTFGPFYPFRIYKIDEVDFDRNFIRMDEDQCFCFTDKGDFEAFYSFLISFNECTNYFIDKAITKIFKMYHSGYRNSIISIYIDKLFNRISASDFEGSHIVMLRYFTSNDIVARYVNFSTEEKDTISQVNQFSDEYQYLATLINNTILDVDKSKVIDLPCEYLYLYFYLAIRDKLIAKYSLMWENEYDNTCNLEEFDNYLEYCIHNNRVDLNDNRSIFSLACFWLKMTNNDTNDISTVVNKIVSISKVYLSKKCKNMSNTTKSYKDSIKTIASAYEKLEKLIGLAEIKNDVNNMVNLVKMQIMRKEQGLKNVPVSLHLVFTGNPGTGKTTIARLLADIYKDIGVLSKGQLIEVDRSGLVAGYVGQTAIKTQEKINEALGGILFIDEAYTLVKDGQDYGQEAIDTILKAMEDHREDFIVIVAGYTDLMRNFINSNPGLKSRFNKYFEFPDYSADELVQIFHSMCNEYQYELTTNAEKTLKEVIFDMEKRKDKNFANARDVRNLFEMVITKQATRLSQESSDNIMEIDMCDFI